MEASKEKFYKQLEEFSSLKDGWIPNGNAIYPEAIETSKMIIDKMTNLNHWRIAPYINGSILMSYHFGWHRGCVNIAPKGVSCFMDIDNNFRKMQKTFGENKEEVINELIEFINASWLH